MPLSEEELRLLEQMERALVAEDPKLASTLRGTTLRAHARRKALLGVVVFVIGVAVLMTGAVARQTIVGVIGFLLMLVSAYVALSAWRSQNHATDEPVRTAREHGRFKVIDGGRKGRATKSPSPRRPMMERLESRWRRRHDRGF
ncbi:MAG: DUF3040 domain-containing protein [Nocardioidaceae bacterium]